MIQGKKFGYAGPDPYNTPDDCVVGRKANIDSGYICAGPCVIASSSMVSCVKSCNPASGLTAGKYTWMGSWDETCPGMYGQGGTRKCLMDCLYGGTPNYGCSSTDGNDIYTKGTSTNNYGFTIEDQCLYGSLHEYFCGPLSIDMAYITCENGCSNGVCIQIMNYNDFLSSKDSYLSGGDFATFISNANKWVM